MQVTPRRRRCGITLRIPGGYTLAPITRHEFRAANIGEVFALLGLEQTLKATMPESYEERRKMILAALPGYQAARAFLLSYDRFEDVPLKGVDRSQLPDAERLLLYREKAPSFGVLLAALGK